MKQKLISILILSLVLCTSMNVNVYASDNTDIQQSLTTNQTEYKVTDNLKNSIKTMMSDANSLYSKNTQYAVYDNGKIVISDTAGSGTSTDSMYGIGSISKMFTTASVMKLADEGKINLDAPVYTYINDFTMEDSRYKNITVRMLLNHSSGLMGATLNNVLLYNDKDTSAYDTFLAKLKMQRLKADPGEFSVYCNDGFTLAQILVERVSNQKFEDYINDNFIKPLNLDKTKSYKDNVSLGSFAQNDKNAVDTFAISGTAGMYSTAEDLCRFSDIFMKNNTILSEDAKNKMRNDEYLKGVWAKTTPDTAMKFGLGWDDVSGYPFDQYGIKALNKDGDTYIYHGDLMVLPEYNISAAVLSSAGSGTNDKMLASNIILKYLQDKGIISEIKDAPQVSAKPRASVGPSVMAYSGFYGSGSGVYANVKINSDGTLILNLSSNPNQNYTYYYNSDGCFTYSEGGEKIKFVKETNGQVYIETISGSSAKVLGYLPYDSYAYQKLDENNILEDVKKVWKDRNNKTYFMVNEKYSSQEYGLKLPMTRLVYDDSQKGYILCHKITDANTAKSVIKIPLASGRDRYDYKFFKDKNGVNISIVILIFICHQMELKHSAQIQIKLLLVKMVIQDTLLFQKILMVRQLM